MTKSEKMYDLVDRWKSSDLTQNQFCGEHDLKVGTFAYWVGKKNDLKAQIAQLKRMLFDQKRERFEGHPNQGSLPLEASQEQSREQQTRHEDKITNVRTRQSRPAHKGRLPLPDHLPVEEVEIYPEGDLSDMVCIGTQVTEELSPAARKELRLDKSLPILNQLGKWIRSQLQTRQVLPLMI